MELSILFGMVAMIIRTSSYYRNHPKAVLDSITSEGWKTEIMVQWETMLLPFYPSKFFSDKILSQNEKPSFYLLPSFKVKWKVTDHDIDLWIFLLSDFSLRLIIKSSSGIVSEKSVITLNVLLFAVILKIIADTLVIFPVH